MLLSIAAQRGAPSLPVMPELSHFSEVSLFGSESPNPFQQLCAISPTDFPWQTKAVLESLLQDPPEAFCWNSCFCPTVYVATATPPTSRNIPRMVAIIFPVPNFFFGADAIFEKSGDGGAAEPESSVDVVGGAETAGVDVTTF